MRYVSGVLLGALLLQFSFSGKAQGVHRMAGARQAGMGGTGVCLEDAFGIVHNQALMAWQVERHAGFYFGNNFFIRELSNSYAFFSMPMPFGGCGGVDVSYFGYSLYSETRAGLAYARELGKRFTAGVKLNYLHINQPEDYGGKGVGIAEIGVVYGLSEQLWLGVHVFNPNMSKWAGYMDERLLAVIRSGLLWKASEEVRVMAEVEKDVAQMACLRVGLEYLPVSQISLRFGAATAPAVTAFGFGYRHGILKVDLAASWHTLLGFSPQLSVVASF